MQCFLFFENCHPEERVWKVESHNGNYVTDNIATIGYFEIHFNFELSHAACSRSFVPRDASSHSITYPMKNIVIQNSISKI